MAVESVSSFFSFSPSTHSLALFAFFSLLLLLFRRSSPARIPLNLSFFHLDTALIALLGSHCSAKKDNKTDVMSLLIDAKRPLLLQVRKQNLVWSEQRAKIGLEKSKKTCCSCLSLGQLRSTYVGTFAGESFGDKSSFTKRRFRFRKRTNEEELFFLLKPAAMIAFFSLTKRKTSTTKKNSSRRKSMTTPQRLSPTRFFFCPASSSRQTGRMRNTTATSRPLAAASEAPAALALALATAATTTTTA